MLEDTWDKLSIFIVLRLYFAYTEYEDQSSKQYRFCNTWKWNWKYFNLAKMITACYTKLGMVKTHKIAYY